MKKKIFLVAGLIFGSIAINAQNVGINPTGNAPDASAMLDVASNEKGVLIPRMSVNDRNNISSPANGLIVYNTDCNLLNYYDCDTWREVGKQFTFPSLLNTSQIIIGKANVAENESGVSYKVPPLSGIVNYTWTVPPGATIVSGQGTDIITVDYSTPGDGFVCIEVTNSCGSIDKSCLYVNICPLPVIQGTISGNAAPHQNQVGVNYSISPVVDANDYIWTVPLGGTIVNGQGTINVTVDFSPTAQSGDICVTVNSDCGSSSQTCLALTLNCAVADIPVTSAASNINHAGFVANWSAVPGAISYYLDVSDDAGFNNLIVNDLNVGSVTSYYVMSLNCITDYYYRVRAENSCGTSVSSNDIMLTTGACWSYVDCGITTVLNDVYNPITGRTWMDRNLGASQVADSSNDVNAYGDLFQWGRGADGHQCRNSLTTGSQSSLDSPGHSNFIANTGQSNWRSPSNNNLWQGVGGVNNPCPPGGYRLPTEVELNDEIISWSSQNDVGAFISPLKLSTGGYRGFGSGSISGAGNGYYWSSTIGTSTSAKILEFNTGSATINANFGRAAGGSVRCIKD